MSFILAGDCFSNPILCDQGLTIAAKIYLEDVVLTYTTPKYIIDSGARRGQGFSIYIQNQQLFSEVAFSEKMWRVSMILHIQRRIQNPINHLRRRFFFQNSERLKAVNYFCKKVPSYMCVVILNAALYWHFCRDPNHIETSPLICIANQWIGFYMIGNSVMKELSSKRRSSRDVKL